MLKSLIALLGWVLFVVALTTFVHIRNDVVAERYALGEVIRHEEKIVEYGQVLRERWESSTDPVVLEDRARHALGMQTAHAGQILK